MSRVYNFSAGPAVLPEEVLKEAAAEMLDYRRNRNVRYGDEPSLKSISRSIIEDGRVRICAISYRFRTITRCLFLQGGGSTSSSPWFRMNLMKNRVGRLYHHWTVGKESAWKEAKLFTERQMPSHPAKTRLSAIFRTAPIFRIDEDADYVYICENNTIYGTKFYTLPNTKGKTLSS